MNENDIRDFWNRHPCGETLVGGFNKDQSDYEDFFTSYDKYRYRKEAHILQCLENINFNGKQVLEIGLGQGADSVQIIKRGAVWSGLDLTPESIERVRTRLGLRNLPHESVKLGSVLSIPFEERRFDIVFSHGVLHHVPDIESAQREIHRILKPNGQLIVMLYAKWSLNYLLSIGLVRRLGLLALRLTRYDPGGTYSQHLDNARTIGLWNYLRMSNFIHKNTDGPMNPYSKVYDLSLVKKDFPNFRVIRTYKRFMHAPPVPVGWLPLQQFLGWHLWVHLQPV
jgi:SAM-dependent methyltransferase